VPSEGYIKNRQLTVQFWLEAVIVLVNAALALITVLWIDGDNRRTSRDW